MSHRKLIKYYDDADTLEQLEILNNLCLSVGMNKKDCLLIAQFTLGNEIGSVDDHELAEAYHMFSYLSTCFPEHSELYALVVDFISSTLMVLSLCRQLMLPPSCIIVKYFQLFGNLGHY